MAEKMSTLVLKVDLDCYKCYNKMRKTLCQLHYEIRSQTWDKKQNTVTISGPFDPQNMSKKLEYKAGKVIKGIEVKGQAKKDDGKAEKPAGGDKPPADQKPAGEKKKPEGENATGDKKPEGEKAGAKKSAGDKKPDGAKPAGDKKVAPEPAAAPAATAAAPEAAKAAEPAKAAEMKMYEPMTVLAYPMAQQPYGVYYQGYEGYEGAHPPPAPQYYHGYGRPVYNYGANRGYVHGSDYFSEENPTCSIM